MALVTPVFLDTTVFLEGLIDMGPASEKARAILEAFAEGRIRNGRTAWHCCLEFYAVSTRLPEEYRLTPEDAGRVIVEGVNFIKKHQKKTQTEQGGIVEREGPLPLSKVKPVTAPAKEKKPGRKAAKPAAKK